MIPDRWYPILEAAKLRRRPVGIQRMGKRLVAWRDAYGDKPVTVAQVADDLMGGAPLRALLDALPGEVASALEGKPRLFTRSFGRILARREETRFVVDKDGRTLRITRGGKHARAVRWRVVEE